MEDVIIEGCKTDTSCIEWLKTLNGNVMQNFKIE